MDHGKGGGFFGVIGIVGCVILYFILQRFLPHMSKVVLWVLGLAVAGIVLLVVLVLVAAFHKPKRGPEQERCEEQAMTLKQSRTYMMELRTATMRIKDQHVRESARTICVTLEQILRVLQDQPEKLPVARSFLKHSLPILSGILRKYVSLEQSGVPSGDVTERTIACLQDLEIAAQKQYESLFRSDVVDITADMEVLTQLCRQNGLLEDDFIL